MKFYLTIFTALLLCGCASHQKTIYNWDPNYVTSLYQTLNDEGDTNEQMANLKAYVEKTKASGGKIAPGVYAHLALLSQKLGDSASTESYLAQESMLFPEISHYATTLRNLKVKKGAKNGK